MSTIRRHAVTLIPGDGVGPEVALATRRVLDAIIARQAQLWMHEASAAVTEIVSYPRLRACRVWLAAGDLEGIKEIERQVEGWARQNGCARLEIIGRKGWLKKLRHADARVLMTRGL